MNCYNTLATVYDTLNYDCDYEKWSQYLLLLLNFDTAKKIVGIDFACGSGILTEKLAISGGFHIFGVDRSAEMLNAAQNNKKSKNTVYIEGDMCKINLGREVDFVNISCDGVNYLSPKTQFLRLLENVKTHLKKDGIFMFDVSSEYKLANVLGNNVFADDTENATYIWQNEYDNKKKQQNFCVILFCREGDKYLKSYEQHKMYVYTPEQMQKDLQENGFCDIRFFDAFSMNSPKNDSHRIQVICKKA